MRSRPRSAVPGVVGEPGLTFFTPPGLWPDCGGYCRKGHKIPVPLNRSIDYCDSHTRGYKSHYRFFVHGMLASEELHEKLGWRLRFVDDPFRADIVLCLSSKAERFLDDPRRTRRQLVLGVETGDGAQVQTLLSALQRPELLAVVKHHSWRFRTQLCKENIKDAILRSLAQHESLSDAERGSMPSAKIAQLLEEHGCEAIPSDLFQKVHTIIPSWLTVQQGASWSKFVKKPGPITERRVDVTFIGSVKGDFRKAHRAGLVAALEAIQRKNKQWKFFISSAHMNAGAFSKALSATKLFVSPWGFGEWSGKDEEAIMAGAVLVKPLASCMSHPMPMYQPDVTCLDVRPDWHNLEAVITAALSDLERLRSIQLAGFKALQPFRGYSTAFRSSTDAFAQMLSNVTSIAREQFAKPFSRPSGSSAGEG